MKDLVLRCALQNAIQYNGRATVNSVLGLVFALDNSSDKKLIIEEVNKIVPEVNRMSNDEQLKLLKRLGEIKKKKDVKKRIRLEKVKGKVVMRFAPNPNGAMSFGHSRVALWNWFFVERYNGKFLLRMDDTDPRIKIPLKEAYSWFKEDLKWLGITPNKTIIQSKRLKIYYLYAEKLIQKGFAYVDTIPAEKMREMLQKQLISDERNEQPDIVLKKWKKMFTSYKEGAAVLRIKTDIMHPNPAVRDWVAFRIIKRHKHPLTKGNVWPTLNFSSAIDDHDFCVTHILRGSDLEISDTRQKYIYEYFGWTYPNTMYNGKFLISGVKSTSEINELIKEGKITGWDDPRLGTLKALRKRGFQAEAIVQFIKDQGIGKNDLNVNISSLESYNKKFVDNKANRYFFIENPHKVIISGNSLKETKVPLHPDDKKRGFRTFKVHNEFYIQDELKWNTVYRFMHLFNVKNNEIISTDPDPVLNAKAVHWLPVSNDLVNVEIVMPDNSIKKGLGESGLRKVKINQIVQFERFSYCCLNSKLKKKMVFYFTHK